MREYSIRRIVMKARLKGLLKKLKRNEIDELEEHWDYIQNRILSNVASRIWGKEFLYKKLLEEDDQAQEALKHFDKAGELIGL